MGRGKKNFQKFTQTVFPQKNHNILLAQRRLGRLFTPVDNWLVNKLGSRSAAGRRRCGFRTGWIVFGRGLGTRIMGQPSYPKARRIRSARYFLYCWEKSSSRLTNSRKVGGASFT